MARLSGKTTSLGRKQADAAKALVKFITAPAAAQAYKKRGMEPG